MDYKELFLDMLNRIIKLEKEIEQLKNDIMPIDDDDDSSFDFDVDLDCMNSNAMIEKKVERRSDSEELLENLLSAVRKERPQSRDKTRYMFNGNVYLKNRLVLAVVKDYVAKNKGIACSQLKTVFDKSLQGSIGVVESESVARQRKDYNVRFFAKDDEILRLIDGNMVVCSQWGVLNIANFTKRAEQLGYQIEQIARE